MKIAVLCPSEIAFRRFMPALKKCQHFEYVGVGVNSIEERYGNKKPETSIMKKMLDDENKKATNFVNNYGGIIFNSYEEIVKSTEIDAVYIPLPPALHFKWAKKALEKGKHVFLEKPATLNYEDTSILVDLAKKNKLALHENYMFVFHEQLNVINNIVKSGEIGEVRLYRINFGFPKRSNNDFRYNKSLGGGALIDAGGYTIKYATILLGNTVKIVYANMNYKNDYNVDMYGSGALINDNGETVQISYGMDNDYKCELEVWGSKGSLKTGRVLTAPADFVPQVMISKGNTGELKNLPCDDTFYKSIEYFYDCTNKESTRNESYSNIERQAKLVDKFRKMGECTEN